MRTEDLIWNRAATERGSANGREGDRALGDLLLVHGLVMNGGVRHAVEVCTPSEVTAAIAGFRYYGFDAVALLLTSAFGERTIDTEEWELQLDASYGRLIPNDAVVVKAAHEMFLSRPDAFAPT